jgi:hypothetical protein
VALVTLMLAITGCPNPNTSTSFSPYSSVQSAFDPVTDVAVQLRPGDKQYIGGSDATVLGWVHVGGSDEEALEAVEREAAKQGGTHVIARSSRKHFEPWVMTYGDHVYSGVTESQDNSYLVIRVPPESWEKLPEVLRPRPLRDRYH